MKLYATVSSERASKGQGGNEYLDIDLTVGDAKNPVMIARLTLRHDDALPEIDEAGYGLFDQDDNILFWVTDEELKGNKQKGECTCWVNGKGTCKTHGGY